jgi:hypothetical protein
MLGSAMMKVADSGRFAERRALISHYVTELLRSESRRNAPIPMSDFAIRAMVDHAVRIVDAIENAARSDTPSGEQDPSGGAIE